ncbi:MAG: alpha/beta fold hydrolase [Gammaproteobacteria bacterium]|jgi:abhydrolase domain-containing protein 6
MKKFLIALVIALPLLVGLFFAAAQFYPEQTAARLIALERAGAQLSPGRTQIPGFEIAYLEGGSGEPLVLVHGFGANKDNFIRVAKALTTHYRVIAIDLPGFGESSAPADVSYDIQSQAERLAQILTALELPRAHLGGSSMGGWIVAAHGVLYPERTQSLWLLAPAGSATAKLSEVRQKYVDTGEIELVARTPEEYQRVLDVVFAQPPFIPGVVRKVMAEKAASRHEHYARIFRSLGEDPFYLEPRVQGLQIPTLIVWGDQDRVLDVSAGPILQALMPQSQLIVMPGIGHLPMIEAAVPAAADYLRFRARISAP